MGWPGLPICMGDIRLIIITGPTASGKSRLAVELASIFGAEVVSADSMQLYKLMDIGTAKAAIRDRSDIAHHMLDVVFPDEDYTAAQYRVDAMAAVKEIHKRGKNVIIVGGTGLYIRALTNGLFMGPGSDMRLRAGIENMASEEGSACLHERLKEIDAESAAKIHPNNKVRIIRALEVFYLTGRPISAFQKEHGFRVRPFKVLKIGVCMDRDALYRAIDERVDRMMEDGLEEEVNGLLAMGYSPSLKSMGAIGYKEMVGYLRGSTTMEEAVSLLKRNTRRYAKRQITWHRRDGEIRWFMPKEFKKTVDLVRGFLQ